MIISPRLMNYVMILYKWKRFVYHVGRARDQYSIAEIGLVAGGKERKEGRQTIFFTSVQQRCRWSRICYDTTKPRKVQHPIHWRLEQDAVYWIHLSSAQDAGLEFWQTSSNAIITYQSVPKECVVKVASENGKRELFARHLTPRKVTLRPSWVHTRSNTASTPRETESNLQAWNSDPNASGSRIWPKEEIEQSIPESTASPTTKLTQTSSTCKESQNKSKNLWLEKEIVKDDSPMTVKKNSWSRQLWVTWNSAKNWQSTMSTFAIRKLRLDFENVHAEDNWTCRKNCSPASDTNLGNSLQMLAWHSKEREEPGMVSSHGKNIISLPKEFTRKIHKKGIYTSILGRFQNDEVFHAGQLQHNWTKEWCEYLDYFRTIDISHKASPEQWERYAMLYHFRYDLKQVERGPIKNRPDYHQTAGAIVSMNKESGQIQESKRRHNHREDLDPEKLDWLLWLSRNWKWYFRGKPNLRFKFHTMALPKISRSACFGKPRSIHDDDRWKANWWTTSSWEKSRWEWNDEVYGFFCLRISHPRGGNYCVCDGECTHTPCRTHIFFAFFFAWRTDTNTHGFCTKIWCGLRSWWRNWARSGPQQENGWLHECWNWVTRTLCRRLGWYGCDLWSMLEDWSLLMYGYSDGMWWQTWVCGWWECSVWYRQRRHPLLKGGDIGTLFCGCGWRSGNISRCVSPWDDEKGCGLVVLFCSGVHSFFFIEVTQLA